MNIRHWTSFFVKKGLCLSIGMGLLCTHVVMAAESQPQVLPIAYQLRYERINMPDGLKPLGYVGVSALGQLYPWLYAGVDFDSGVQGQSGGYFALSVNGGLQYRLWRALWGYLGARVGGGGGRSTPVGGGLFTEPYVGLGWRFHDYQLGLNYSHIKFHDGAISSSQVGLNWTVFSDFPFLSDVGSHRVVLGPPTGMSWKEMPSFMSPVFRVYIPNKGILNTHGVISDERTYLVGVSLGHYLTQHVFLLGETIGAFHGRSNGYAEASMGAGYEWPFNSTFSALAKLGLGAGGGGDVDTGGGFLIEPAVGLEYKPFPAWGIELDGGYTYAPDGDFKAKSVSLQLKHYFNLLMLGRSEKTGAARSVWLQGLSLRVFNQTYFRPKARTGDINPSMQLLAAALNYQVYQPFYLTGQTAFAYKGRGTGGYFSGMLGAGAETPRVLNRRLSGFAEGLIGTAGGGNLAIGDGALWEPRVGANLYLTRNIVLQAAVGRLMAFKGGFNSTTLNVGLSWQFSALT